MTNAELQGTTRTAVIQEAVAQYESDDTAKAIAYVVQETDAEEREATLRAIIDEVNPEELSRLEKREVFLIQRRKRQHKAKERITQISIQLAFDSRR